MNRADAEDPIAEIGVFVGATSLKDVEARLCEAVATEVDRILALTAELDAFDVVELMRQREMTISPVLGLDPGFDGSGAAIELIALVMRTRGERKPATEPQEATRPNEVIAELHDCAKRLLRLAIYRAKVCEQLRGSDPLARLSAEYQSYLVGVRALQYDSIAAAHERELFDRPEIDEALRSSLGFTYREFVTTRDALQDRQNDILTALRDTTADIFTRAQAEGREPDVDESKILRRSFIDWLFLPGARAAFTATDIAAQSGLEPGLVERILNGFSVDFDPALDATRAVVDFLHARNPLGESGLLRSDGRHVLISGPIGGDSFRTTVEAALTNTPAWDRYDRTRRRVSETLAVTALERALDSHCFASSFEYFAPRAGTSMGVLGSECGHPNEAGDLVEADALFLVEDVAICLEVKGRSVARAARRGDVARLKTEIKKILGHGADQARRLESLIRENGGVWRADRTWLDLSQVRETHTVVAGLDYFGPLGVSLGDLGSSGLLGDGPLPWIASLHDLEVISRVVDRPAEFLLYLRRRTNSGVAKHYRGSDELDLFMLFMDGGLFVEDDPDEIHRRYPRTPPPTRTARTRFEREARPTFVGTHTDRLDAWMYWIEGSNPDETEKPVFNVDPSAAELVDFVAHGKKPGWLRVGADLLALSGQAQRKLAANVERIVQRTEQDSSPHTLTQGFASTHGYLTFFARTMPPAADRDVEANLLYTYMLTKKHQVGSDRSFGLLLNHRGRIEATMYMNHPPGDDETLDELGRAIGLKRTWKKPKRPPALSKKKRKRRRRR